jgi:3-hydroxyacyl-CoA dehydrogenase
MFKPFQTAAVLGAGVMGSQIAAHLANAGLTVHLLDLPSQIDNKTGNKNELVEASFKKALKLSPSIFFTDKTSRRVKLGNFEEHFSRLAEVDWVIEAVVENLTVKRQLMERLVAVMREDAIASTNTSGLPITAIAEGLPESFHKRFLGTHFFNPPRYLKLLELIPTVDTDPLVLERMQWFAEQRLGKGVVIAKDTPNFIANRIGMYVTMLGLKSWLDRGYTIEEIDALTGTLMGRPKSATFRTADLVGLDTLLYVLSNLYPAISQDESREIFQVPNILRHLVETGTLGAKTGQGFYKKQGGEILSLNPLTFAYEPAQPLNLGDLEPIRQLPTLHGRLQALYQEPGRAGLFFRAMILSLVNYAAHRIPEIANSPVEIDRALRWGFGWELGPFEIWDALGFETILNDMKASGMLIPAWIEKTYQSGVFGFYPSDGLIHTKDPTGNEIRPLSNSNLKVQNHSTEAHERPKSKIQNPRPLLWHNPEAALVNLGDGVVMYEFRSKGNTLSLNVVKGLKEALDLLEAHEFRGLVIGNHSSHFSGGANLAEIGMMAQSGNFQAIENLIVEFQALLQRIHYFPKPIVAAVQGRALGGGCELVMACPHVVAAAETYIGLVELGVGLIPGAGGIMRMVTRMTERAASETTSQIQPFLRMAFETIATAKVSTSAYEAQELGFLPCNTRIVLDGDRRLEVAKAEVLHLDAIGYAPPPEANAIMVLGRSTRALFEYAAYLFQQGGYASDHDRYLANKVAYVMTGGDLSAPTLVHENYLLQLERENFIPLLQQPKTQARIAHMLKTKKPLRN